jgi:hypothetical protein
MRRSNFIVWLGLVLVFSKLQCVSACAIENCASSAVHPNSAHHVPPCHRHHNQNSGNPTHAVPCAQQLAVLNLAPDRASAQAVPLSSFGNVDAPVLAHHAPVAAGRYVRYDGVPPPNLPGISPVVLRI